MIERIGELAPLHTDAQIADILNQEGYRPGLGGGFTENKVQGLRWSYGVPKQAARQEQASDSPRADGRYSARAAAEVLNVDVSTIADWCQSGKLEAIQEAPHCPRWIRLTPEVIAALRKPERQRKPRHSSN